MYIKHGQKNIQFLYTVSDFSVVAVPSFQFLETCKHGLPDSLFVSVMIPNNRLLLPLVKTITC